MPMRVIITLQFTHATPWGLYGVVFAQWDQDWLKWSRKIELNSGESVFNTMEAKDRMIQGASASLANLQRRVKWAVSS